MKWTPKRIRRLRDHLNETQKQFARRLRVNVNTLRCWEQGKGEPSGPATMVLDLIQLSRPREIPVDRF